MKHLQDILNPDNSRFVVQLAASFSFKAPRLFLEKSSFKEKELSVLTFVVDVDETAVHSDMNWASLLEVKLSEKFDVNVEVLLSSKITDPLNRVVLDEGLISLNDVELRTTQKRIQQIAGCPYQDIIVSNSESNFKLPSMRRRLAAANEILSKKENIVEPNHEIASPSDQFELALSEFLSPENQKEAKEALKTQLATPVLCKLFDTFYEKKRVSSTNSMMQETQVNKIPKIGH